MRTRIVRRLLTPLLAATALAAAVLTPAGTASADVPGTASLAAATTVGIHNTYDQAAYPYLADALDAGASMVELDSWFNVFTHKWNVSHGNPLGDDNNCVAATTAAGLHGGDRDQDLGACLDDIRLWLGAHPGHPPVVIKLELKAGFDATIGMGPAALDSYVAQHLGDIVFRPADLLAKAGGGAYPDLDTAARAGNWPSRAALAGKVILEVIPGTVEESNPFDHLWTDVEYAGHLRDLAAAGTLGSAQIFPSVLGAAAGDPRTRYADAGLRPWFVVFDGDAATYLGGIDTSWYDTNHYLLVMTDAQNVAPALDDTAPPVDQARARVAQLAAAHASVVSCDWRGLTTVLPEVLPRG
ncbi:phosphatidylinositol-specific phospholipase C domain-containing protein [Streptantibioticus cattleyicolor]|uniref:Phosphatidylinositol-specific phospholipase C1 n=1 Tax=Streptantibioticus cattleyicolor (strain ATCC 35852 / DSM 46488 / JCM 4925 / NBRC 14057 / NRRL 8057) TaxID=1003195 RepID=F8JMX3_STREN|nr:phosphatidylinositol-specific phospholipase C domain-containing protein [Streptantibioticus cattleyicolor]AEW99229.1 phosphatidylinositol-specific phospholipase C1 [Streptantibioticus cattleyicolor NRRL 8057 = DSM 46488]CCB71729.1 Phosphatidylinositol-specific phospholipase C1 [Streptantibioticus cattleyicolor NRRL 8057 = DSM 46488]